MEFTKEEIETALKVFETYKINPGRSNSYNEFLSSLFKPETKFIDVRIEYQINKFGSDVILYEHDILGCLTGECYFSSVLEVTELPEVFTREDMIELGRMIINKIQMLDEPYEYCKFGDKDIDRFIERKSK